MLKRKKGLSVLLAIAIMTSSLLTACGTAPAVGEAQATSAKATEKAEVSAAETTAAAETTLAAETAAATEEKMPETVLEQVDITWYAIGTPQKDQQVVMDEMNKTIKEKLNATLIMNTLDWGVYNDKMKVIMAGGEPFDICFTAGWTNNYNGAVAKGAYLELDDLIQQYGKNILEQMPAGYWDAMKIKGKIYGIFNYQVAGANNGFVADKALVEKYNFDYKSVKKFQDLEPFVKAVKEGEGGKYTASLNIITGDLPVFNLETGVTFFPGTDSMYLPLFVGASDMTMKAVNLFETPEMMEHLKITREWYQKGYEKKDLATMKDLTNDRKAGNFSVNLVGNVKPGNAAEFTAMYGHDVVDIPIAPGYIATSGITATLLAISKNSPNPERAMMLIDLLWSDKALYNMLCFGIEGTHYTMIDDMTVEPVKDSAYNPGTDWEFGNQFNAFFRKGQAKDTWELTKKLNESATKSTLLGFVFDREVVKNEAAAIEGIMQEYLIPLYVGAIDPVKHLPILNEKLKQAGIEVVASELQKQIDQWKLDNGK